MRQFELLNHLLSENGINSIPLADNMANHIDNSVKEDILNNKVKKSIKESDLLAADIDMIVEAAMKDTLKTTIRENGLSDEAIQLVENSSFNSDQIFSFMEDTIHPILETVGGYNKSKMFEIDDKNKVRGIHLPIYEIALTLEAARMGALSLDSLEDTPVKNDVDPDAQDLESIVDASIDQTYNFGKLTEAASMDDLTNVHQYMDHEDEYMRLLGPSKSKGKMSNQVNRHSEEVDFNDVSDIEGYEGEIAGDGDGKLFSRPMEESTLFKLQRELLEMMDNEAEFDDVSDIEGYEGEEAGCCGEDEYSDDEYSGDGTADEAIIESQSYLAKTLLASIFNEYGIYDQEVRKAMVREAIHYIFKYGINNLYPMVSDVSQLVTEQNTWADLHGEYSARFIIDNTVPVLSELQEASIQDKSIELLQALAASKTPTMDKSLADDVGRSTNASQRERNWLRTSDTLTNDVVSEAVSTVLHASGIERQRQALRYRMNKFNENAKMYVASGWATIDRNLTEAAEELKPYITVKRYISEAPELKQYFSHLKENSPIAYSMFKKHNLNHDTLTSAAIVTELGSMWTALKSSYYNQQPIESKFAALETMLEATVGYKRLCTGMKNPNSALRIIENFEYRLENLSDKIENKINTLNEAKASTAAKAAAQIMGGIRRNLGAKYGNQSAKIIKDAQQFAKEMKDGSIPTSPTPALKKIQDAIAKHEEIIRNVAPKYAGATPKYALDPAAFSKKMKAKPLTTSPTLSVSNSTRKIRKALAKREIMRDADLYILKKERAAKAQKAAADALREKEKAEKQRKLILAGAASILAGNAASTGFGYGMGQQAEKIKQQKEAEAATVRGKIKRMVSSMREDAIIRESKASKIRKAAELLGNIKRGVGTKYANDATAEKRRKLILAGAASILAGNAAGAGFGYGMGQQAQKIKQKEAEAATVRGKIKRMVSSMREDAIIRENKLAKLKSLAKTAGLVGAGAAGGVGYTVAGERAGKISGSYEAYKRAQQERKKYIDQLDKEKERQKEYMSSARGKMMRDALNIAITGEKSKPDVVYYGKRY